MYFYYDLDSTTPTNLNSDKAKLKLFIEDVKSFLSRLTKHKHAFIESVYDDVVNAWKAAENRFDSAVSAVAHATPDMLDRAGLTGPELKLKLRNVENTFGELISRFGNKTLRRFFDTINSLLKSLADAAGFGSALEEIKDAIRDALSWART